jgi:hypothetical protein
LLDENPLTVDPAALGVIGIRATYVGEYDMGTRGVIAALVQFALLNGIVQGRMV